MNLKQQGMILKIVSAFATGLWVAGLIIGSIYLVLLAILIVIIEIPIIYLKKDNLKEMFQGDGNVVEDERTQLINEKASSMTLGIFLAVIFYVGIIILALRDSFPEWTLTGYTLIGSAVSCLAIYMISRVYYSQKY
ncbi:MAG: DUF2178 domain-containing protein [Methanobacteriaceae archaeon]|jgi:uncharacterized membrane protein|nr:DUF2178 domain-containing protein [Methanobacteriaceae archaeon]MDP2836908.1 DUF2178 domain-containing protein [Methanobacteriaceae archaeon]MDP3034560.1 DUF2178 domain-containing protein [Methanobacteriaceae archaeon]MDP3484616.1 DUF2178 domain-containing protein [Methanobacteriaceae archaeon]MDP3623200.1 DUF2178 domain-containing protein [Methanobacteriaceae archaeon]